MSPVPQNLNHVSDDEESSKGSVSVPCELEPVENTPHTPASDSDVPVKPLETQISVPLKGQHIRYSLRGEDEWFEGKVHSRAGKAKGKYRYYFNIQDVSSGDIRELDFQKDVSNWSLCEEPLFFEGSDGKETTKDVVVSASFPVTHVFALDVVSTTLDAELAIAKKQEYDGWIRQNVFENVADEGQNCISTRWVITTKKVNSKNIIKARLVARGFEEEREVRADSPTCAKESLRLVLAILSCNDWPLFSLDIKTAFLQGNEIDRDLYLRPPSEFAEPGYIWKLRKCVYGLVDASRAWYLRVREALLSLHVRASCFDQALFMYHSGGVLHGLIVCHVDDFLYSGTLVFQKVMAPLRKCFL